MKRLREKTIRKMVETELYNSYGNDALFLSFRLIDVFKGPMSCFSGYYLSPCVL